MSDLGRLRKRLTRAEEQVKRWEREIEELRDEYRQAGTDLRPEITRKGQHLKLVLSDASKEREQIWQALRAEENRLLEPAAMLRFS